MMDIEITGHNGFYQLRAVTAKGTRFMRRVSGFAHGAAYSDDTRLTRNIADGAHADGLSVTVNGKVYLGNNAVQEVGKS